MLDGYHGGTIINMIHKKVRVIEYDKIEEWSPWLDEIVASIGPKELVDVLRRAPPEYLEDARDVVIAAIGRERLVDHLNRALDSYRVRVFHGTRVTPEELRSIEQHGLRAGCVASHLRKRHLARFLRRHVKPLVCLAVLLTGVAKLARHGRQRMAQPWRS